MAEVLLLFRILLSLAVPLALIGLPAPQSAFRPLPKLASPLVEASSFGRGGGVRAVDASSPLAGAPSEDLESRDSRVDLELRGELAPEVGFEGGELAHQRMGWRALLARPRGERSVAAFQLETEATFYDWGGGSSVVPGVSDPFNDLYHTSLGGSFSSGTGDSGNSGDSSWFTGLQLDLAGEDDADPSDSLSVGAVAGLRLARGERLRLSLGLSARSRLEDSPWVLPFLGFEWKPNEDTRLSSEGSRLEFSQRLGSGLSGSLYALYDWRQYRLNDRGPLPSGVFRDEEIRLGAALEHEASDGVLLRLDVARSVWREMSALDSDGDFVGEIEPGDGWVLMGTLRASF